MLVDENSGKSEVEILRCYSEGRGASACACVDTGVSEGLVTVSLEVSLGSGLSLARG